MKCALHVVFLAALLLGGLHAAAPPARKLLDHQNPEYPRIAIQMSLHGTVRLRVWVTPQGSVRKVEYIGGHPLLAESAVKAVKNWKFESASRETTELLEIKF
ncbi:MAG TPA: energy transducer TonB [Terriglobia bacterium]|nr:energy transducer TonB [Terriglobia bacterium]